MNNIQKSRLAQVALFLLQNVRKTLNGDYIAGKKLNMEVFCSNSDLGQVSPEQAECGTNLCILGFAALLFPNIVKESDTIYPWNRWTAFSTALVGSIHDDEWAFLFEKFWPNKVESAARRILYYLTEGMPPEFRDWEIDESLFDELFLVELSDEQVIKELTSYVIA